MKKGADSTGKVMHTLYVKERLVICNEEDTDGRARVTDEERVLPVDWTEIRLTTFFTETIHIILDLGLQKTGEYTDCIGTNVCMVQLTLVMYDVLLQSK